MKSSKKYIGFKVIPTVFFIFTLAILFFILINYYLIFKNNGAWFFQDDFFFLLKHQETLAFGPNFLEESFFRPISRNLFWWGGGKVCGLGYSCFFNINLFFLLSGLFLFVTQFWRVLKINTSKLIFWTLIICSVGIFLLKPSTLYLASWISNSQANIAFFLFAILSFYIQNKIFLNVKDFSLKNLNFIAIILILIGFSNIGYFLTAFTFTFFYILLFFGSKNFKFTSLGILSLLFVVFMALYYSTVVSNAPANSPYKTSFTMEVLRENLNFYNNVDKNSILAFIFSIIFLGISLFCQGL